jgi:hypothetical protein
MTMTNPPFLEVRTALEQWRHSGPRTWERLEMLVQHWCRVYDQSESVTEAALKQARQLMEEK